MKRLSWLLIILLLIGCQSPAERAIGPDEVMYFILTDRFYDGDPANNYQVERDDLKKFHGGDFKGIAAKLDYLQDLGVTMIWITPVQQNVADGYHGYWIDDFYAIEPHLGSLADLQALTKDIHRRGMKLIVDFVINHTGYDSNLLAERPDWFHPETAIHNWGDKQQVEQGWLAGLPDLDQSNPEVAEYLIGSALWLIEQTGIDGFRLDTVRHVERSFWEQFVAAIKAKYPDFYLIGEVYDYNPPVLNYYKQTGIDGMLNYPMYRALEQAIKPGGSFQAVAAVFDRAKTDPSPQLNGMFIDNHDNVRFLSRVSPHGTDYLTQAITFIMTTRQIPIIYYGTEVGLSGGADPDNRQFFPWDQADNILEPVWTKLLELRADPIYRSGELSLLDVTPETLLYQVASDQGRYLIGLNNSDDEKQLTYPTSHLTNFLQPGHAVDFVIPGRGIVIYRSE